MKSKQMKTEDDDVKEPLKDSARSWVLAARPKTLTGAAVPVMIGLSMAYADQSASTPFHWIPAFLCLLFAFIMQVDANFINDYFDFIHGNDDETRLGPKRACAMGWVSVAKMKRAIAITTVLACVIGLPLIYYGGFEMVAVGLLCVVFCFLYTTHLSYLGLFKFHQFLAVNRKQISDAVEHISGINQEKCGQEKHCSNTQYQDTGFSALYGCKDAGL